jgi:phage gp29-like protein
MISLPPGLRPEIATLAKDFWWPLLFGNIARSHDDVLLLHSGGRGIWIYDDLEQDCHIGAVLRKRRLALVSRPWLVDPAGSRRDEKKAADLVTAQLAALDFEQVTVDLLDALLKGYAIGEVMWDIDGDQVVAREIRMRDQRRFHFDAEGNPRLLLIDHAWEGVPVPEKKFIVHRWGAKDGNPNGLGLGASLFWPGLFKRQGTALYLTFVDRFATPTPYGTYQPGSQDQEQQTLLLQALEALGAGTAYAFPETMKVQLLEAMRSGGGDAYDRLLRWLDEQISECVLGETLSTNTGSGHSHAAAKTHDGVRRELIKADGRMLASTLNRTLVRWIVDFNMPGTAYPSLRWDTDEPEDLQARAQRDQMIASLGFKPTLDYITRTYGEGWEPGAAPPDVPPAPAPPRPPSGALFAAPVPSSAGTRGPEAGADPVSALAAQLDDAAGGLLDGMLDPVRQAVLEATDYGDLSDRLLALHVPVDQFAEVMARAMAVAALTGWDEVSHGG